MAVRALAIRHRCVDVANNGRHAHLKSVPRLGGIAIAAGFFGAAIFALHLRGGVLADSVLGLRSLASATAAVLLILLLGLYDDLFHVGPYAKLFVEGTAAAWMYFADFGVPSLAQFTTHSALRTLVTLLVNVCWILVVTNAFNLIDGLDGLACGCALIAVTAIFISVPAGGSSILGLLALALAGSILGFLPFNSHPASIFLGDSGSLFIGFVLGALSLNTRPDSTGVARITFLVAIVLIPLIDLLWTVVRRFVGRKAVFRGDADHIHHRLTSCGFSHRDAVLTLCGISAAAACLATLSLRAHWIIGLLLALVLAGAWFGLQRLSYLEFAEIVAAFQKLATLRSSITNNLLIRQGIAMLRGMPADLPQICHVLRLTLEPLGFSGVSFHIFSSAGERTIEFASRKSNGGIVVQYWRPQAFSRVEYELRLLLTTRSGISIGDLRLSRERATSPQRFDMNLLCNDFRSAVAGALERSVFDFSTMQRIQFIPQSRSSSRLPQAILPRN